MKTHIALLGLFSFTLSGCWTLSETEYPAVDVTPVPAGKTVSVRLANYRTGVYDYIPVEGHETMNAAGAQAATEEAKRQQAEYADRSLSWHLQNSASGRLVSRSIAELERKGYKIDRENSEYVIEAKFFGPEIPKYDALRQIGYGICTLCTAEKNEVTWKAKLAVYDSKYEKVLFAKDYEQNYCVTIWGPIPIASPGCNKLSTTRGANCWALTALNDQILADATAFIAGQKK